MPRIKKRPDASMPPVVATIPGPQLPQGYQQITSLTSVVSLTPPDNACLALIQCEGAPVRWRDDGVDPTASVGMRLPLASELRYDGNLITVRFIQEASGAKLNISYYG